MITNGWTPNDGIDLGASVVLSDKDLVRIKLLKPAIDWDKFEKTANGSLIPFSET